MFQSIDVHELKARLDESADDFVLLDCREASELASAAIPGALHIPVRAIPARIYDLDKDTEYAVLCHHGVRSTMICSFLTQQGFQRVLNVTGGIDAYAKQVDPSIGLY